MIIDGRVIKGVGGRYTVLHERGQVDCSAKGKIKLSERIMIGDFVKIDDFTSSIIEISPRKNQLIRPAVANIDCLLIVTATTPAPDLLLVDKLIIFAMLNNIEPLLIFNKHDIDVGGLFDNLVKQYSESGLKMFATSASSSYNMDKLTLFLNGKLACFSGQSAVGKSSIINTICGKQVMDTGELSQKLARGRHTTRHAEIIPIDNFMLVDTPGFSMLELRDIEPNQLDSFYPEYITLKSKCKYRGRCSHRSEPDCQVKAAVDKGLLSKMRYERYLVLLAGLNKSKY